VNLHRLRRLLGTDGAVTVKEGRISLDRNLVWVDAQALEEAAAGLLHDLGVGKVTDPLILDRRVDGLLHLYKGDFLGDEGDSWALGTRDRLRDKLFRVFAEAGSFLEQAGLWQEAVTLYRRGLELDDVAEELYRRLMVCHRERGEHAEALRVYQRCRDRLVAKLDVPPSPATEAIRRSVMGPGPS
jgi:two-component SAPR family response regulator